MKTFCLTLTIVLAFAVLAKAWPNGAPPGACNDLLPHHGVGSQEHSTSYHTLKINQSEIDVGEAVHLQLSVEAPNPKFKGFMIQSRNSNGDPVGTFSFDDNANIKQMPCDGVTHTNANKKSVVDLLWTAPDTESDLAEGVHFVYTVVEEKTKFWAGMETPAMTVRSALKSTTLPFESTTTVNPDPNSGNILKSAGFVSTIAMIAIVAGLFSCRTSKAC